MEPDELHELAKDPRFVPGIFNYCDRWCERCPFTSRCLLYAMSEERRANAAERDPSNAAFWQEVQQVFALTRQLVTEMATKLGIDLDQIDVKELAKAEQERRRPRTAAEREVTRQARQYARWVDQWFTRRERYFRRKQKELRQAARMNLPQRDPVGEALEITDAVEVIRWYQHQIYIKLKRAGWGDEEPTDDPDEQASNASDRNGSAKVALIGIDRSLAAWGRLYRHFEKNDAILKILVLLERLRRLAEQRFPEARAFHRPVLDD